MEQESSKELKWSVCRVFNKRVYYDIRRHINPNEEGEVFGELKSSDIHRMFWDVCWSQHFKSDKDFTVLKVDDIKISPKTQFLRPRLVLETKVLKTEDTRHIDANTRKRQLEATGSLAGLLGNTLKIADILVICKNHLVTRSNFDANSFQWSIIKKQTLQLNYVKRPHTMIFVYRHDGQFNYRTWSREIQSRIDDQNWQLRVRRTQGVEHGACVLIQPEEEFSRSPLMPVCVPGNLVASERNMWNSENMAPSSQEEFQTIEENFVNFFPDMFNDGDRSFFHRSPSFKTPSPNNKPKKRNSPVAKENQSPQPGPSSRGRLDASKFDELNDGPSTASTKRMKLCEKRVSQDSANSELLHGSEDYVSQATKKVCTEWGTQPVDFGTQD